jgi:hypothetical protein
MYLEVHEQILEAEKLKCLFVVALVLHTTFSE